MTATVGRDESTIGVALGNALLRYRAARGEKGSGSVSYQDPRTGVIVTGTVANGKPGLQVEIPLLKR
ncbi:MAG TPA: hypothetical protein PKO06_18815 [Candidatus Ozemobacteraceae bacterium]|nr:hypothetical protein [Candidatus Ozemobacteraceae bacterium]